MGAVIQAYARSNALEAMSHCHCTGTGRTLLAIGTLCEDWRDEAESL